MNFFMDQGIPVIELDMIATLALAIFLLLLGRIIVNRVGFLSRFCIPAPLAGGLLFSLIMLVLHETNILNVKMDTILQTPFMLAFFATVGLIASLKLVKKGGKLLFYYWALCAFLSLMQNVIGVSWSKVLGLDPLLGVLMGAVSMEGGHGNAGAFGPEVEAMGVYGATAVAMAAATFGVVAGGVIGGPLARFFLNKYNLRSTENEELAEEGKTAGLAQEIEQVADPDTTSVNEALTVEKIEEGKEVSEEVAAHVFLLHGFIIAICMVVGMELAVFVKSTFGFAIPNYVGGMFFAVLLRNINDKFNLVELHNPTIGLIGDVCLGIFLSMALMTLKLWELADLALPMIVILMSQVIFMIVYNIFVAFPVLGKSYDAVIMCAGMAGHGLGATPNAMANMKAVIEKYGPSTKAFLIVPLCGAFLVDLFAVPCIVWFINYFAH
ncbi:MULTISPECIES: sodium/glutamate symporter [Veillonella]|uniref:sodium/glutamate symporter n=1 Tax=Veillonella TaxID=29465 RepID=UPI0025FE7C26|nr:MULTISPECIES: sodium/glutamate symporter [Veillonella]